LLAASSMGFSLYWQPAIVTFFSTLANKLLLLVCDVVVIVEREW